jgi:SAM-dependent methyltransferase
MKSAKPCRVCKAAGSGFLCTTPNEHSEQTELEHYRCAECGSVFVGNEIGGEELGQAYATLNTKAYYEEIASENRKKMLNAIEHLQELIPRSASVLDLGTGNGQFVERLHEAGFTDLSAHEIPGADLSGIEPITQSLFQDFDYASVPSDRFDAVTLLDVVEHVPEPQHLMDACHRVLRPGGVLYFHTPVVTRTDRLMHRAQRLPVLNKIGRAWQRGRTSIFHLENYTPKALSLILARAGFGDVAVRVRNELSWPVSRYVRVYLLEKQRLPGFLTPLLTPLLYPVLATDFFNGNKSIVSARKLAI